MFTLVLVSSGHMHSSYILNNSNADKSAVLKYSICALFGRAEVS